MRKFEGTKNQWRLSLTGAEVTTSRLGILEGSKSICTLNTFGKNDDEVIANGRLIAAAPGLLEAAMTLEHYHDCEQEGLTSGQPTPQEWITAVDRLTEAIDKALGITENQI